MTYVFGATLNLAQSVNQFDSNGLEQTAFSYFLQFAFFSNECYEFGCQHHCGQLH